MIDPDAHQPANALAAVGRPIWGCRCVRYAPWVLLSVRDNGRGLPAKLRRGFGMLEMMERVRQLGGTLTIENAQPGVLVGAGVPFQPASAQGQKFFAYNSTTRTDFTGVYMAPAGTENWGPN